MFQINERKEEKYCILDLEGTMDQDGTNILKDAIQESRKNGSMTILLNFTNVTNVQSSSLQLLLSPIRTLVSIKGKVGLYGLTNGVHRTLKTAMFYPIVRVYETEEKAIEDLTK